MMTFCNTLIFMFLSIALATKPHIQELGAPNLDPLVCNLNVNANASPTTVCNPGQTVNLSASTSGGNVTQVMWTPSGNVINPNALNTQAIINQTTTFQVTVMATDNQTLIVNGNFNSGNSGFTSDYGYATNLFPEGLYWVGSNPQTVHSNFANCSDHTGGGDMMVVNGAGTPNQDVWCQTIPVNPNTTYNFSAWVTSVVAGSPAQLQFFFNGAAVGGIFSPNPPNCNWQQFNQNWNSGGSASVQICIVNQNTVLGGNDFAIDDLFFAEVCEATDFVTVTLVNLNAAWTPPNNLCVSSLPFSLNTLLGPTSTPGGNWTVNGFPTSIFDPAQWGAGAHTVTYSVSQPPCTDTETHFITVLPLPLANFAPPPNLCISTPAFNANNMLLPGSQSGGTWMVDGFPTTNINPAALGPGPHIITYTVGTFPCVNSSTQTIEIANLPNSNWTPPAPLCANAAAFNLNTLLQAGAQTGGVWRINGSVATTFNPATLGPGNHNVSYTVGNPPCSATQAQTITVLAVPPVPAPTCGIVTESSITITWPPVGGVSQYIVRYNNQNIPVGGTSYTINNLTPGQSVQVQVQSQSAAGCTSALSAVVTCTTLQCIPPTVTISPVSDFCFSSNADTIHLEVVVSDDTGNGVWSGTGIVDATLGVFDPVVAGIGMHQVVYYYQVGTCPAADTIHISILEPPTANLQGDTLICVGDTATFTFTGMADSASVYTWTFPGGQIVAGNGAGPYQVTWPNGGDRQVSVFVQEGICRSDTAFHTISVQESLIPPVINCQTTSSSITFYWDDDPAVADYAVQVTNGASGTMISPASYEITGLTPGSTATIELTASSGGPCPDVVIDRTCIAADCPAVQIDITAPGLICVAPNQPNVTLTATVTGGSGTGVGVWQGDGIINATTGLFSPSTAPQGANVITYTYTENNCSYSANTIIEVYPKPTASFLAIDTMCMLDTLELVYTGNASSGADYQWNLADGEVQSGSGAGPLYVTFPSAGLRLLRLRVEENGCLSTFAVQGVQVDAPIDVPVLDCDPAISDIEFYWNQIPAAQAFIVIVLDGPFGQITSDTSFNIPGLQIGQEVEIRLTTVSSNSCPGSVQTLACLIAPCGGTQLDLLPPADICLNTAAADTIDLEYTLQNTTNNGVFYWEGPGIIDPSGPAWSPQLAGPGSHTIIATYLEGFCLARDSVVINVNVPPTAGIDAPTGICENETASISYQGNAGANAIYYWDFDGGNVQSGFGKGPYEVMWDSPGNPIISLVVEENGCASDTVFHNIHIGALPVLPDISCQTSLSTITFSWLPVAGATSYDVDVLTGPTGMVSSDTSIVFTGLATGQTVQIAVTITGDTLCPPSMAQLSCTTNVCPPIDVEIAPVAPICFSNTSSAITLQASTIGGGGGGALSWSGNGIINSQTGAWQPDASMTGQNNWVYANYTENGCLYSDSLSITVFATPVASFTLSSPICETDADTIIFNGSAGAGASFVWDFAGGNADPGLGAGPHAVQWNTPGSHVVTLSVTENGCTSTLFGLPVVVDDLIAPPVLSCSSDLDQIDVNWPAVAGAEGYDIILPSGLTYTNTSATGFTINNLSPGASVDITVVARDTGACQDQIAMITCTTPDCPALAVNWTAPAAICVGQPAVITWDITGATPIDVNFSFGGNNQQLTVNSDGQTTVLNNLSGNTTFTLTSATAPAFAGCPVTLPAPVTVNVNQPLSAGAAGITPALCSIVDTLFSLETLLTGETSGGAWTDISVPPATGGTFNATAGSFNTTVAPPGLYQFRYTVDAVAPCVDSSAVVAIRINPNPFADAGSDQVLNCEVNTVILGGQGTSQIPGLRYTWSSTGGAIVSDPAAAFAETGQTDTYTLTVADPATGCFDTDEVVVSAVEVFLIPHITISPLTCFESNDGSIRIDSITGGNAPYQYSINGQPWTSQSLFAGLTPGNYQIQVRDDGGCEADLTFNITQPDELLVHLSVGAGAENNVVQLGDSVLLEAQINIPVEQVDTIMWRPASPECIDCLSIMVAPTETTPYSITIIDENGCSATDRLTLFVEKPRDVYIPSGFSPNNDGTNDIFMIFAGKEVVKIKSFKIFNRWGESLFEAYNFKPNDPAYGWTGWFRGQLLNAAVFAYFAEVEFIDGEVIVYKGDVTLMR